jgi:hypothetical protein
MSRRLKRKEDLREGLQRISEKRLQDMLQLMSQVGLTAERVHDARKFIKSLRAILRLTAGALPVEVRKTRNQALRDLADRLSGPRDAVTLHEIRRLGEYGPVCCTKLGDSANNCT